MRSDDGAAPKGRKNQPLGIQSVEIGFGVLEALVRKGGAVSLTELARQTGLQPSKLHRYLVSLSRCGLASQSLLTGLYDLGPSARRLGVAAFNRFDSYGLAQDQATILAGQIGQTVLLFIWTEHGPTLIRVQNGARPSAMVLRVGSSLPVSMSAVGVAFTAFLPTAATQPLLDEEGASADPSLLASIEEVRRQGWFWSTAPILPSAELLVVPVFEAGRRLHSVIAVAVATRDVTDALRRDLIAATTEAASKLSAELGG